MSAFLRSKRKGLDPIVEAGPPVDLVRSAEQGVKPAKAVPGSSSTLRITATASSGSKVSACSTQMMGAVASCTPRLIAAARPRVPCWMTSSPAASAMATEESALPQSTASTSAGGGSSAASERNNRGSPAASFSIGMTMATPVIALDSPPQPRPERQVVRTVEVGETLQHGEKTEENSLAKGRF